MKFLLKTIVALASILGIVLVIAFFIDPSVSVERSKVIHSSPQKTYAFFKHIEKQGGIHPWLESTDATKIWHEGTPGEIGSKLCWESSDKRIGKGEQEMISEEEGVQIVYKVRFFEPKAMEGDAILRFTETASNETNVSWQMDAEIPYPWNLALLFSDVEKEIGIGIEKRLNEAQKLFDAHKHSDFESRVTF